MGTIEKHQSKKARQQNLLLKHCVLTQPNKFETIHKYHNINQYIYHKPIICYVF